MKRSEKTAILVSVGCWGYPMLEYAWRGWSHWSMALAGGICCGLLGTISDHLQGHRLPVRCAAGCAAITGIELIFGCIFNLGLHMQVWDYSEEWLNLGGQICARYAILWFLLSAPLMTLTDRLVVPKTRPSASCKRQQIRI